MPEPHTPSTSEGTSGKRLGDARLRDTQLRDAQLRDALLGTLLGALVRGWCLADTVPLVLDVVEREPLASGGRFAGDLVRALMELPGTFWGRYPGLYTRYQAVLRANAVARTALPIDERMQFWAPLADRPHDGPPNTTP